MNPMRVFSGRAMPLLTLSAALAYMALVYFLAELPGYLHVESDGWLRAMLWNLLHIPLYAGLAFIWMFPASFLSIRPVKRSYLVLGICIVFGLVDEWHQMHIPTRSASILDIALDAAGAGLGIWLYRRHFGDQSEGKFQVD